MHKLPMLPLKLGEDTKRCNQACNTEMLLQVFEDVDRRKFINFKNVYKL